MQTAPSKELSAVARRAAQGGLFLFAGNASATVLLALGAIFVVRLLGPANYGLYSLTVTIPVLLAAIADVGMNFALVRLPARLRSEGDHARADRLVKLGFLLKLSVSAAAAGVCYAGSSVIASVVLNRPELTPFVQLASLIIIFQAVYDAVSNTFIGRDLMHYSAGVQILQAALKGVLAPALVFVGFGITGAIWGSTLALAAAGLTGAILLFSRHVHLSAQTTDVASTNLRALLGYGLPLYAAATLSVLLTQYQNIVLAHFASNVEVGNFGATWTFTTFMMILTYPVTTAMFPMFSKMNPMSQRGDLARGFTLAVKYMSLLMIPASVVVMVFSRDLIRLTFGGSYTLAPQYLVLLAALYLLSAISYLVLGSFLNGVADTWTALKVGLVTLAVYLPLGPALAWLGGPSGLLIAYALSIAASTIYGVRQVALRHDARPDLRASGRILLAAFGAAVPVLGFVLLDGVGVGAVNLAVGGILYVCVYATLAPVVGAVNVQDINNLRTLLDGSGIVAAAVNHVLDYEMRLLHAVNRDLLRPAQA